MGDNRPIVSFIVPALNEELNLPPLFKRLLALERKLGLASEILVIDDSSTDGTLRVAQEAARLHPQIRPFHKPLPHGLGCGVRAAIRLAKGKIGVVVMADGVDPMENTVPEFCKKILEEGCHLVLLSRYTDVCDAKSIPRSYRFCHTVFRFCTSTVLGIPYLDTTYAFRAFDVQFVKRLNLRSDGFAISPELTFKTHFSGGKIGEVSGRQTRRVRGESKFLFSKAALPYAKVLAEGFVMRLQRRYMAALGKSATS